MVEKKARNFWSIRVRKIYRIKSVIVISLILWSKTCFFKIVYCGFIILSFLGGDAVAQKDPLLKECPDKPNCVSTTSSRDRNRMDPITYKGSASQAQELLVSVISSMPGAKITENRPGHIVVTFTSAVFRFVDDVELVLDDSKKVIHFRSASRIGYYDLGVNRKRMNAITRSFLELEAKSGL